MTQTKITRRKNLHARPLPKAKFFRAKTDLGDSSLRLVASPLKIFPAEEPSDPSEILKTTKEFFPTCDKIFTQELIQNPLLHFSLLKDTMNFYNASTLTQAYMRQVGMTELNEFPSNVTVLVWLSSLFDLPKDKVNNLIEAYSELNTLIILIC